jgi:heme exporter protein A
MELSVESLACRRGERLLFDGLSFTAGAGDAVIVTGPNGAGKTSLLRMIAGLLPAEAGAVALDGAPVGRESLHLVGHLDAVKGALTVRENLEFSHALLGGQGDAAPLEALGLGALAELPTRVLSAGQKRRLALARLLVAARPLWLLDEPTASLDADGQARLAAIIAAHRAGGGIVVAATHAALDLAGAREVRIGAPA